MQFWIDNNTPRRPRLRVGRFLVVGVMAWYDLWIGAFYDGNKRRLYILPLPCIGFYIQLPNTGFADQQFYDELSFTG